MKTGRNPQDLGWDVSFWFAVSSPLLGVLVAILTLMIFFADRMSHEPHINRFRFDHPPVPVRFGRVRRDPPATAGVGQGISNFLKCRSPKA